MSHALVRSGVLALVLVLAAGSARAEELATEIANVDQLYKTREQAGNQQKALEAIRALAKAHPDDFEVNWRVARALFWAAEGTKDKDQKRALALEGRAAGEKAAAQKKTADSLYWTSLCIGEYSHSVGILTALSEGLEAKFRDPLLEVSKLAPQYDNGGVWNALGRYKFELPWPKRDYDQSVAWLRKSVEVNPSNLRGRVYLAESLAARDDKGDEAEAKKLLSEVLQAPVGRYDTAEELRAKDYAKAAIAKLGWDIK